MEKALERTRSVIKRYGILMFSGWTFAVILSLASNLIHDHRQTLRAAAIEARTYYDLNKFYRITVADFGGIYVSRDKVSPNPYLSVPDRDVMTTDGKRLTLMNPAYMTRIVFEKIQADSALPIRNKITSLKALNPINAPDGWEREALISFENGEDEVSDRSVIDGHPYLRLIKPFVTEEGCLKCHARQDYKIGDIRGGISISIPLEPYLEAQKRTDMIVAFTHGILWLVVSTSLLVITKAAMNSATAYEETKELSMHDPLTKLANRRCMALELEKLIAEAEHRGAELSAIMLDIDFFKAYNDTHGHEAGDKLLAKVAGAIKDAVRITDLAVRYGGEEFLMLLPRTETSGAVEIAERIRSTIERELPPMTVSLGVASHRRGMSKEELIEKADQALYRAKQNGRNLVEVD